MMAERRLKRIAMTSHVKCLGYVDYYCYYGDVNETAVEISNENENELGIQPCLMDEIV
jgi:hypothetical protein